MRKCFMSHLKFLKDNIEDYSPHKFIIVWELDWCLNNIEFKTRAGEEITDADEEILAEYAYNHYLRNDVTPAEVAKWLVNGFETGEYSIEDVQAGNKVVENYIDERL